MKFTSEIDWATEMIPKEQKTHKTNVNTQKKDKKRYRKKRATGSILWHAIEPKSYGSYRIIVILRVFFLRILIGPATTFDFNGKI